MITLRTFAATRWRAMTWRTRTGVEAFQAKRIERHLDWLTCNVPFYGAFKGRPLDQLPIMDKTLMLANFGALNSVGIASEEAWAQARSSLASANSSARWHGLTIGMSSGTSGNRGLFLVNDRERYTWLGAILAKALPEFPLRSHRVALLLAMNNDLYGAARESGRLPLKFFDLRSGVEAHRADLERFNPTVIVAPPKALRLLSEARGTLKPHRVFSGAEVLDPSDAKIIEAGFGVVPQQIYQATEGFLGVSCGAGRVHLNEDFLHFELEPIDTATRRYTPIITDFTRRAQAMVRYRMNDILVMASEPCPCGSPLMAIERIEGRCDDVIVLPALDPARPSVPVMPDAIRNAVLDADPTLTDFRVIQTGPAVLMLRLPAGTAAGNAHAIASALHATIKQAAGHIHCLTIEYGIDTPFDRKLRRVERRWHPGP